MKKVFQWFDYLMEKWPNDLTIWMIYQAVDEEVDGGVDYCQVAGGEVSEPLGIFFILNLFS